MNELESRAELLASRLNERREMLRMAIAPPNQRKPFTTQLTAKQALSFWREHRFDDIGKAAMETWQPEQIMALDQWLTRATEAEMMEVEGGI